MNHKEYSVATFSTDGLLSLLFSSHLFELKFWAVYCETDRAVETRLEMVIQTKLFGKPEENRVLTSCSSRPICGDDNIKVNLKLIELSV
jgi:hypothetical protein